MKKFYFLVPPELGGKGRLIVDLARFYDLCLQADVTWNSDEESLAASQAGQPRGDCPYLNNLDFVGAVPPYQP